MKSNLRRFFQLVGKHKRYAIGVGVLHVLMASVWFVEPLFLMIFMDVGLLQSNLNVVFILGGLMLAWIAVAHYLHGICKYHVARLGEMVLADLRCQLFSHAVRQPPSFFGEWPAGRLVALHGPQVDSLLVLVETGFLMSATVMVILLFLVVSFIIDAQLAVFLFVPPLMMLALVLVDGRMRHWKRVAVQAQERVISFLKIRFSHIVTIQAFQSEDLETDELRRRSSELVDAKVSTEAWAQLIQRCSDMIRPLTICTLMVVGGSRIIQRGDLSLGTLVAVVEYSRLLITELNDVFRYVVGTRQSQAVLEQVFSVLDKALPSGSHVPARSFKPGRGRVQFKNVWFRYSQGMPYALQGVNFSVEPGEFVVVVGASGSGKSTLFRLLLRLYDPDQGTICLDGQDIRKISLAELRAQIAPATQDPVLFDTTLAKNIAYGWPAAPRSEVEEAAEVAVAREFIERLPEGFDTLVGEGALELSGGQRHRVALARVVLKGAPLLLLDEITSALDAQTEVEVMKAVRAVARGRSTLMVAHRLSTVHHADRILVMDQGQIVQVGTHSELYEDESGLYRRLCEHHQLGEALGEPTEWARA